MQLHTQGYQRFNVGIHGEILSASHRRDGIDSYTILEKVYSLSTVTANRVMF